MAKTIKLLIVLAMGFLCVATPAIGCHARKTVIQVPRSTTSTNTAEKPAAEPSGEEIRESLFPEKSLELSFSKFTWGVEVGSSLDMTSHDLTTFDANALLGYKNPIFNIIGVGAGIHRSIHSGNNFIPVYVVLRTDFRKKPSPLFLSLQGGYSFNTLGHSGTLGDWHGSIGLGINLAQTRLAKTYVLLSLAYQNLSSKSLEKIEFDTHHIFFARLLLGVNF